MSELIQEMCKLLKIRRINSTAFNPQMQGKVEKFHLGVNQSMSHYVNQYGSDWDDFVNYAVMAHRAIPHSVTRYSPYYLLHGREMRLPMEDDLTMAKFVNQESNNGRSAVQDHIDTLADRLKEAYRIVRENNRTGREKQKEYYDKGTKLRVFQPGDMVYLREMVRRKRECPKFRIRWKGPYTVIKRLSDLNYLVRVKRGKEIVVNLNKMKRCWREGSSSVPNPVCDPPLPPNLGVGLEQTVEDRINSPIPYSLDIQDDRAPTPSTETNRDGEDQVTDPTWEPDRRQETRLGADDERPERRDEPRVRYWLRSRSAEGGEPEDSLSGKRDEQATNEPMEVEPSTSSPVEVDQGQAGHEDTRSSLRYNFRPLPGRKFE
jgi:hypothetical protein